MNQTHYDCLILGGGLAGLSLAILLAKQHKSVLLVEKKKYPYHKVCGEYISMESYQFLKELGVELETMNLPIINRLHVSSVNGKLIEQELDLGGFGLSRFQLDAALAQLAIKAGVRLLESTTAFKYSRNDDGFLVETNNGIFSGKVLCSAMGKHSSGNFFKPEKVIENWVGIKYHIQINQPKDLIALHNFEGGYCGISAIEDNKYCLCYLVKASQLKKYDNNIESLQKEELCKNPFLKRIFNEANFLFKKPITVSNVTFTNKIPVYDHVFYLGDASGTIAPLSGNGMSMAMHAAKMLSKELVTYFNQLKSLKDVEIDYTRSWNKEFKTRISTGKVLQHFFCNPALNGFFIQIMSLIKPLRLMVVKRTHGNPF